MFSNINNILWTELQLLKFYFHQHYHYAALGHPFLISHLFQHGHFLVLGRNYFYSQGVLVEISLLFLFIFISIMYNKLYMVYCTALFLNFLLYFI